MADRIALKIHGMDCAEEVAILKREVGPLVGGENFLSFDILKGVMTVLPGEARVNAEDVIRAGHRTGMKAERLEERDASLQSTCLKPKTLLKLSNVLVHSVE